MIKLLLTPMCVLLLLFSLNNSSNAQVSWSTTSTGNIRVDVCQEQDTVRIQMTNTSGTTFDTDSLVVQLPPGIFYVPGSIVETSGFNVTFFIPNSSLNKPTFVFKSLPDIAGTVDFSFRIRANCNAIGHFESGGNFRNTYTYYHDGITEPPHTTPDYNINYPALSFSNVVNANINTALGSTYTQQITVTNGGNGPVDSFYVALNPPAGMSFSAATNGILNATNDTLFFNSSHLGVDGLFTSGENIVASYQIRVNACINLSTNLDLIWGCDAATCKVESYPIAATVPSEAPIITARATPSGVQCFDEPDTQRVMLINTGTGLATNMIFEIFSGNPNGNPATAPNRTYPIDTASIQVKVGAAGAANHVSPFFVQRGGFGYCNVNNRIGRARINLADVAVGDTVFLSWTQTACCPSTGCNSGLAFNSWEYKTDYENECQTENYTTGYLRGSVRSYDHFSFYSSVATGPTNVTNGDTATFIMEYTASMGLTNQAPNGTMEIEIVLPTGVRFDGNLEIFNRTFTCSRIPNTLTQVGDTIRALYNFSNLSGCIGNNGSANKAEIHVGLIADCSNPAFTGGTINIPISTYLVLYPSCSNLCKVPFFCQVWTTDVNCPEPCARGGIQFERFSAVRTNIGAPDNDNNGTADASGSIDMNIIRSKTLITGDTLELRYAATVDTGTGGTSFAFAYLNTSMTANGRILDAIDATIQIFDASTGTVTTCNSSTITTNTTNDFSIDINTCMPSGFVFEQDDSIAITAQYRFGNRSGSAVLVHEIENDFFVSNIANPTDSVDKFVCNTLGDNFKTMGFYHTTCCGNTFAMQGCDTREAIKNYYLSIGPCCSNYANGNYFRNEIRQFSYLDTFEFDLPAGYEMDTTQSARFNYVYTGGSRGYANIVPIDPTANPVRFVLGGFFEPNGGTYPISDEGYYGTVRMFIKPNCNAQPASRIRYNGFYTSIDPNNTAFTELRSTSDLINYTGPDLDAAAITPVIVATNDTVTWQIRIDNNSNIAAAENTFFGLNSGTGSIVVQEVRNLNTNTIVTPNANGLYLLGQTPPSTNNQYEIIATQNSCVADSLTVMVGWNCSDYPTDLASYPCDLDTSYLRVTNPESAMQVAVLRDTTTGLDSVAMCTPITYEIELTSSQASRIRDMQAQIPSLPTGLNFVTGSVSFEYPQGSGFVATSDPTVAGSTLIFDIASYSTELTTKGIDGTINADSTGDRKIKVRFDLQTDCNFITGDAFDVQITANRPCTDPLPVINYTTAPILIEGTGGTPYSTRMRLSADEILGCGTANPYFYNVSMVNLGPGVTSGADNMLIRLPANITYMSYTPATAGFRNAPVGQPTVQTSGSGTDLSWSMPSGLAVGDSMVFSVRIDAADVANTCGNNPAEALSLINKSIVCVADGSTCSSSTPSGRGNTNVLVNRPILNVGVDTANSRNFKLGSDNIIQIVGDIRNTGSAVPSGEMLTVEFFCDNDASGGFTVGDTYIGMYNLSTGLAAGATHNFLWRDTFSVAVCDLNNGDNVVAVMQDTPNLAPRQCACEYSQRFISDIILPVEVVNFDCQLSKDDCTVNVHWQTMAESNINFYEIERSIDGITFEAIHKQIALNKTNTLYYSWKDATIQTVGYYYRLKITHIDGITRYSDYHYVTTTCGDNNGRVGVLAVYPNPATEIITIKFWSNEIRPMTIKIVDMLGRIVLEEEQSVLQGVQNLPIDLSKLPNGAYSIQLNSDNWATSQQFIKE